MASCEPCPCYSTPTASFPIIVPYQQGVCESKVTIPFSDGIFYSTWSGLQAYYSVNGTAEQVSYLAQIIKEYQSSLKNLKSSVHNATKTAITSIYLGRLSAFAGTDGDVSLMGRVQAYADKYICWILQQKAYDGPCAYTVRSIAQVFGTIIPLRAGSVPLAIAFAVNSDALGIIVKELNTSTELIIKNHNCCSLTPLKLPIIL